MHINTIYKITINFLIKFTIILYPSEVRLSSLTSNFSLIIFWITRLLFWKTKNTVRLVKTVNDTPKRAVKKMQDFRALISIKEEQKNCLIHCLREHRNMYPDYKCKIFINP